MWLNSEISGCVDRCSTYFDQDHHVDDENTDRYRRFVYSISDDVHEVNVNSYRVSVKAALSLVHSGDIVAGRENVAGTGDILSPSTSTPVRTRLVCHTHCRYVIRGRIMFSDKLLCLAEMPLTPQ